MTGVQTCALPISHTNNNHLSVTAAPVGEDGSVWRVKLTKMEPLPLGILNGMIVVETNDPDSHKVEIPYVGIVVERGS